jgi:hypothetical protein
MRSNAYWWQIKMNDFTKEELETIFNELRESREWSDDLSGSWPLLDKIQSMIDNYCDHEYYLVGCGDNAFGQCHKCGDIGRIVRAECK